MIENIKYKTKLEDLLNLNELIEIINKYSLNFEKNLIELMVILEILGSFFIGTSSVL